MSSNHLEGGHKFRGQGPDETVEEIGKEEKKKEQSSEQNIQRDSLL